VVDLLGPFPKSTVSKGLHFDRYVDNEGNLIPQDTLDEDDIMRNFITTEKKRVLVNSLPIGSNRLMCEALGRRLRFFNRTLLHFIAVRLPH